jgi:hypothetical protein
MLALLAADGLLPLLLTLRCFENYLFGTSCDQHEHLNVSCWSQLNHFENYLTLSRG